MSIDPPQGDLTEVCRNIVEAFDRTDAKDNAKYFLMGNFNVDYKDNKTPDSKECLNYTKLTLVKVEAPDIEIKLYFTMQALGLTQLVTEPTRLNIRNGLDNSTLIDLIFSNSDFKVMNKNLSNHMPVMTTRKKSLVRPK